jgi:hypothetical protein
MWNVRHFKTLARLPATTKNILFVPSCSFAKFCCTRVGDALRHTQKPWHESFHCRWAGPPHSTSRFIIGWSPCPLPTGTLTINVGKIMRARFVACWLTCNYRGAPLASCFLPFSFSSPHVPFSKFCSNSPPLNYDVRISSLSLHFLSLIQLILIDLTG